VEVAVQMRTRAVKIRMDMRAAVPTLMANVVVLDFVVQTVTLVTKTNMCALVQRVMLI